MQLTQYKSLIDGNDKSDFIQSVFTSKSYFIPSDVVMAEELILDSWMEQKLLVLC